MGKRQEKAVNIYGLLLLMTAVFVSVLLFRVRCTEGADGEVRYTVETERQSAVETAPRRTKININTASAEELDGLSGVGSTLAEAIVEYRTAHGAFRTAEELLEVKGIGEAKLDGFRAEITLSEEEGST